MKTENMIKKLESDGYLVLAPWQLKEMKKIYENDDTIYLSDLNAYLNLQEPGDY